ncbi:hypothetical protein HPB52_006422 [Rhipicephalus sanguineus]|uniref:Uncharacterized protein n=1 Tax=Rhipicephalus sanguineus TaxID=34632 RepID=A0A9D4Q5U4_RHISA|nr:hypothetical protein HPB52_006422 [Rhipicephalus sanguineus]
MSGINWAEADAATVAFLNTTFIEAELGRRRRETTGSREALIQRLAESLEEARAARLRLASAPVSSAGLLFPPAPTTSSRAGGFAALHACFARLAATVHHPLSSTPQKHMTTMFDVSSSLPLFENCQKQSARLWNAAAGFMVAIDNPSYRRKLIKRNCKKLAPHSQRAVPDSSSQSLRDYAYAKLRVIGKCPASLTESRKVEYLLHGILCASTATTTAAQRPSPVTSFIDICTELGDKGAARSSSEASSWPQYREYAFQASPVNETPSSPSHSRSTAYRTGSSVFSFSQNVMVPLPSVLDSPNIPLLGSYDAFPDTAPKITLVSKSTIKNLPLMPWTHEP